MFKLELGWVARLSHALRHCLAADMTSCRMACPRRHAFDNDQPA